MNRIMYTVIMLVFAASLSAQNYIHGLLEKDTTWKGTVYIDGDIIVPSNVRLLIEPGTKIVVAPNTDVMRKGKDKEKVDITVKGSLIAKGLPERKILFTSASKEPMMADWYGINIKNKQNTCILEYVIVEYAYYGINIINSKPIIKNSEIRYNYLAGIYVDLNAQPNITGCAITGNDYAGIKCDFGAKPIISDCIISENSHGVIAFKTAEPVLGKKEKNGTFIGGNNRIFENFEYNIYNHSTATIYAQNNNWLTTSSQKIDMTIYDNKDDSQYGKVVYRPLYSPYVAKNTTPTNTMVNKTVSQPEPNKTVTGNETANNLLAVNGGVAQKNEQKAFNASVKNNVNVTATSKPEKSNVAEANKAIGEQNTMADVPEKNKEETKPVVENVIKRQKVEAKPMTAEEKILADIISGKKLALEYQLDNKPIKRIKVVQPKYPAMYEGSGRPGRVFVRVEVGIDGRVQKANILKVQGGEEFGKAALEAVKQFEYTAGKLKGHSVKFVKNERFDFHP